MATTHNRRPGEGAAAHGVDQTNTIVPLTKADVIALAWQSGYDYALTRMAEAAEELTSLGLLPPPVTAEERVQERLQLFERCAADFHATNGTKPFEVSA